MTTMKHLLPILLLVAGVAGCMERDTSYTEYCAAAEKRYDARRAAMFEQVVEDRNYWYESAMSYRSHATNLLALFEQCHKGRCDVFQELTELKVDRMMGKWVVTNTVVVTAACHCAHCDGPGMWIQIATNNLPFYAPAPMPYYAVTNKPVITLPFIVPTNWMKGGMILSPTNITY